MDAAQGGLASAAKDKGLVEVVSLLLHLPHAARSDQFVEALAELGVVVDGAPTASQIAGAGDRGAAGDAGFLTRGQQELLGRAQSRRFGGGFRNARRSPGQPSG